MSNFDLPSSLVELAAGVAEQSVSQSFEMTPQDAHLLAELEYGAETLGFLNQQYFIQAYKGLIMPAQTESATNFTYIDLNEITLEGKLFTYSKVHIGKLVGAGAVRAVCMAFESVTLLPFFDKIPEDQILHIPVLAVSSIEQTS